MEIIVASLAGFCFGVNAAVNKLEELIKTKEDNVYLYTLGDLIHNPAICEKFALAGVKSISPDEIDGICSAADEDHRAVIVIRAHGVTKDIDEKLRLYSGKSEYVSYADCTCPHVKKIHKIVSENSSDDTITLVFGDRNHPEVQGICSYAKGECVVFGNTSELDLGKLHNKQVVLVSQTTQNLADWEKSQKFIKNLCTNSLIFDTICSVTENRQGEVEAMSGKVDAMLIIGGRNSSNTNKLFEISRRNNSKTYFIENPEDLPIDKIRGCLRVGIAAGASTPGYVIEEVKTTMNENETKNTNEAFEEMLKGADKPITTGDTVTGTVTHVSDNEAKVDLGAQVTGIIPASDIIDPTVKLADLYHVGDTVTAIAVRVSDVDGVATLSRRKIEGVLNWQAIVDANANGDILEGKVIEAVKGGVIIVLKSVRVFIPASQTGLPRDADMSEIVGTIQKAKIIEINEQRKRAVASIKVVKREERRAAEEAVWSTIEEGKHYDGVVKSLTNYGAFVDIGGIDGMVHLTELSWGRIKHPSDVCKVGDHLDVYVISFDREKKRISLGHKTADENPWNIFTNKYQEGDVAEVRIVSLLSFGAFAEVVPGVDGLIHISQIADKRIESPAEVLKVGDVVNAKITAIDYDNQKISLSIRALIPTEAEIPEDAEAESDEVVYSDDAPAEEAPAEEAPVEETPAE
ncbi:MAG: bifunctional 4-hydroxy-3-methylbut-2-enyl diphosphate reductase/30S ribosomal protein S1 [Clostridia bacterium]|nr:bifunctional 4-hydroxy-3-methylbut-2-enyl diphosphate reductase/30S ribosomal protein S1 [Clostridia bacterium]